MEHELNVHGLRIFAREQGSGHPLLMINGLGGNAEMWGPAERTLSKDSRTIVFDAPGTGRSSTSPIPLPLPAIARLLARLLDNLQHEQVDVVGYSLGGAMAQQFAHTFPDRVRRLALVATSCGWGSVPPDLTALTLIATPARYLSPHIYKATSHLLDGGDRFRDPALKRQQAATRNAHPPTLTGYAQQFLQGTTWSSLHWAHTLTMPTLVIGGDRDRLVPAANQLQLAERIPDSRVHVLPGEGHLMLFDPQSDAFPLLSEYFGADDHETTRPWVNGEIIEDDHQVERALRSTSGAQPYKVFNAAYRAWVRGPVVRRVFGS